MNLLQTISEQASAKEKAQVKPTKKKGFKAGETVRLKASAGSQQQTAKIKAMLTDIEGGVFLDKPLDGSRYWNVDDLELMIRDGVFEAVKPKETPEERLYYVMIPANVYDGRYYSFRTAQVKVLATSKDEAIQLINSNQDDVLRYLSTRRAQPSGRSLLPAKEPAKKNVFFKDSYYVKELGASSSNDVLTRHGGFKQVRLSKGVTEAKDDTPIGGAADYAYTLLKNSAEGRRADWRAPSGNANSMEFEARYFGTWEVPAGEVDDGDYDWEVPTKKTEAKVEELLAIARKHYPKFKFKVSTSEKNWLTFTVTKAT